jgi:hypothetical protein
LAQLDQQAQLEQLAQLGQLGQTAQGGIPEVKIHSLAQRVLVQWMAIIFSTALLERS